MPVSAQEFRAALGAFPAGVTVVTSIDGSGEPVGATVSAFTSVSLDPPLVLVALQMRSRTAEAIALTRKFVVHVVDQTGTDLALTFGSPASRKFEGIRYATAASGVPELLDCETRLLCRVESVYSGGDHILFLAQVEQSRLAASREAMPVVWCQRRFHRLSALPIPAPPGGVRSEASPVDLFGFREH